VDLAAEAARVPFGLLLPDRPLDGSPDAARVGVGDSALRRDLVDLRPAHPLDLAEEKVRVFPEDGGRGPLEPGHEDLDLVPGETEGREFGRRGNLPRPLLPLGGDGLDDVKGQGGGQGDDFRFRLTPVGQVHPELFDELVRLDRPDAGDFPPEPRLQPV